MTRLQHVNGKWSWSDWSRRDAVAAGYALAATVLALAPVAYVALTAPPGNYASKYAASNVTHLAFTAKLLTVTLPSAVGLPKLQRLINDPAWQLWLVLPNIAWIVAIVVGWASRHGRLTGARSERRSLPWPLIVAAVWIVCGVLVYLPWPTQTAFYMLPFSFGMAFGTSWILSRIDDLPRAIVASMALLFVLVNASIEARDTVHLNEARIRADLKVIAAVKRLGPQLPLFAAVPDPAPSGVFGWGLELAEYGRTAGGIAPVSAGDVTCGQGQERARSGTPAIIVSGNEGCGRIHGTTIVISELTARRRWPYIMEPHKIERTAFLLRSGEGGRVASVE